MLQRTQVVLAPFAKFRKKSRFYYRSKVKASKPYNAPFNRLREPKIADKLKGMYADEVRDMSAREHIDDMEAMRSPKERDFYQDHTYHQPWLKREMEADHRYQLSAQFMWMKPGFQVEPWIWHPGDTVEVVKGDGAGARGAIIAIVKYKNQLIVQNVNVQDVTLPATDTRPEQIVQREHPITVDTVKHVDPSTNEICDVKLVKARNKETGALEEKRISLASGVMMPIPEQSEEVGGSPLHDTPFHDAAEDTYQRNEEIDVLVQRKLRAIENHFVGRLKKAHEFHAPLAQESADQMKAFQADVVDAAEEELLRRIAGNLDLKEPWWQDEVNSLLDKNVGGEDQVAVSQTQ